MREDKCDNLWHNSSSHPLVYSRGTSKTIFVLSLEYAWILRSKERHECPSVCIPRPMFFDETIRECVHSNSSMDTDFGRVDCTVLECIR